MQRCGALTLACRENPPTKSDRKAASSNEGKGNRFANHCLPVSTTLHHQRATSAFVKGQYTFAIEDSQRAIAVWVYHSIFIWFISDCLLFHPVRAVKRETKNALAELANETGCFRFAFGSAHAMFNEWPHNVRRRSHPFQSSARKR